MRSKLGVLIAGLGLAIPAVPAMAHHSFAAEFDASKRVTLTGTVTKLEWLNPHIWIYIDAKEVPSERLYDVMATTIAFHQKHANQGYNTHVSLLADQDASYNTIIKILDAARQAGDDDVGFVTQ